MNNLFVHFAAAISAGVTTGTGIIMARNPIELEVGEHKVSKRMVQGIGAVVAIAGVTTAIGAIKGILDDAGVDVEVTVDTPTQVPDTTTMQS